MVDMADKILAIDDKKYEGNHKFLSESLLMPLANSTNGNRGVMFSSHISQAIQLVGAEKPLVGSGFENQVLEHSSLGYKELKDDYEVLHKFVKNQYNYILLVQNKRTNVYSVIERNAAINLTEDFGVKYDNSEIDKYSEGDIIKKNTVLYHDSNYDDDMNAQYGTNLNVAYVAYKGLTNEDSIVLSESAAKKVSSTFTKKITVPLNNNDIPLNILGDDDNYKIFPEIGESIIENQPLMVTRRLDYKDFAFSMRDSKLRTIIPNDTRYYGEGKVIDINVYSNIPDADFSAESYNEQTYKYYQNQKKLYKEFLDVVGPIMDDDTKEASTDLLNMYSQFSKFYDTDNVELLHDGKKFDHVVVEFTLYWEDNIQHGIKLTNR